MVQMSGIFENSKVFVDMKCKKSANNTLQAYATFSSANPNPTKSQIRSFVLANFDAAGLEYEAWSPPDFKANPRFLKNIASPSYKAWASDLNNLWIQFGRKQIQDVDKNPDRYSLISLPNPVILASSTAREFSYWDNYWTIPGLLACEMYTVSKKEFIRFE